MDIFLNPKFLVRNLKGFGMEDAEEETGALMLYRELTLTSMHFWIKMLR